MTDATQVYKQFIAQRKKNKSDLIQISIALGCTLSAFFCICFFKELAAGFLIASTFSLFVLLSNVFIRDY